MAANMDAMLRAAVEAYRNGNKAGARVLLEKILEIDEYNENAWMWMSATVETPDEKRTCLENVLVINPNNEKARIGMKSLNLGVTPDTGTLTGTAPASAPAPSMFKDPAFNTGANQGSSIWDEDDVPPTATSSASSVGFRPSNTNEGDLDSWISGMGIGGATKQPSLAPTPHPFSDAIFDDDVDDGDVAFDEFDDRMDNMFSADEFDIDDAPPARSAASARSVPPSNRLSPKSPAPSLFDDDDDDSSPFDDDMGVTDDEFDEFAALLDDEPPARQSVRQSPMSPPNRTTSAPLRTGTARAVSPVREEEGDAPDAAQFFALIPREIEVANRLPGENEDAPRGLLIGMLVLVVLNLGVLGYILVG